MFEIDQASTQVEQNDNKYISRQHFRNILAFQYGKVMNSRQPQKTLMSAEGRIRVKETLASPRNDNRL